MLCEDEVWVWGWRRWRVQVDLYGVNGFLLEDVAGQEEEGREYEDWEEFSAGLSDEGFGKGLEGTDAGGDGDRDLATG